MATDIFEDFGEKARVFGIGLLCVILEKCKVPLEIRKEAVLM